MNDVPTMNRLLREAEKVTTQQLPSTIEFTDNEYRKHGTAVDATMKFYTSLMCGGTVSPT